MTWIAPLAGRNPSTLAVSITQLPVYHLLTYSPQQQQQDRREEQPKCYFQYFHPLSSPPSPPDLGTCFVPPLLPASIVINYINGTRHKLWDEVVMGKQSYPQKRLNPKTKRIEGQGRLCLGTAKFFSNHRLFFKCLFKSVLFFSNLPT